MPYRLRRRARLLPTRRRPPDGAAPDARGVPVVTENDLTIRPASPQDEGDITRLYVQLKHHHAALMPSAQRYQVRDDEWAQVARDALADDDQHIDVVTFEGSIVAFVRYHYAKKPWGKSLEIETLVVDEEHRGRAVGRLLMDHAERTGRDAGAKGARVQVLHVNDGGKGFYEGLGYEVTSFRYAKTL